MFIFHRAAAPAYRKSYVHKFNDTRDRHIIIIRYMYRYVQLMFIYSCYAINPTKTYCKSLYTGIYQYSYIILFICIDNLQIYSQYILQYYVGRPKCEFFPIYAMHIIMLCAKPTIFT